MNNSTAARSQDRLDPDLRSLSATAVAWLDRHVADPPARRSGGPAADGVTLADLARLGWTGLGIPEDANGSGGGVSELAVVMEHAGHHLLSGSFLSTVGLVAPLVSSLAPQHGVLGQIASGEVVAALLTDTPESTTQFRLERGGAPQISGRSAATMSAGDADVLVLVAGAGDDLSLCAVRPGDAGVHVAPVEEIDPTRPCAAVNLDDVVVEVLAEHVTTEDLRLALDRSAVVLAAEQIGGATRCLRTSVDYANTREQFDVPIGSFQSIAHQLAEILVDVESAGALVDYAAWAIDHGAPDASTAAALAAGRASEAYWRSADSSLHVHGGIGFTWEQESHWHLRRALAQSTVLGSPATHFARAGRVLYASVTA